jgi:hypothetical protein
MSEEQKNETVQKTEAPAAPAQTKQEQGPDLTVQDLQALRSIIDVASSRGAFKPNEMTAVGTVYTKLDTFLKAVATPQAN